MEFLFDRSTQYLTSECSEQVRYWVEDKKRNSMATTDHKLFVYYINIIFTNKKKPT